MILKKLKDHKLTTQKPKQLSDPYFDHMQRYLDELLAKDAHELTFSDYRNLFSRYLPAGTFEEVVYYLPLSITYICRQDIDDQSEIIDDWVIFIFKYAEQIYDLFNVCTEDIVDYVFDCNSQHYTVRYVEDEISGGRVRTFRHVERIWLLIDICKCVHEFERGQVWVEIKIEKLRYGTEVQRKFLYELYEECNEIIGLYLDDDMMLEVLETLNFD